LDLHSFTNTHPQGKSNANMASVPPRLDIPREETPSSSAAAAATPEGSPRVYSLAKSFSERFTSRSPRNMMALPSSLALGPTAAGGGGSAPGSGASSPRKQQGSGSGSGPATPTRTMLQRFHTASPSSPMSMGLRSPSSYRGIMGEHGKKGCAGMSVI